MAKKEIIIQSGDGSPEGQNWEITQAIGEKIIPLCTTTSEADGGYSCPLNNQPDIFVDEYQEETYYNAEGDLLTVRKN